MEGRVGASIDCASKPTPNHTPAGPPSEMTAWLLLRESEMLSTPALGIHACDVGASTLYFILYTWHACDVGALHIQCIKYKV